MVFLTGQKCNNNSVTLAWPDETDSSLFEFLVRRSDLGDQSALTGGHYINYMLLTTCVPRPIRSSAELLNANAAE